MFNVSRNSVFGVSRYGGQECYSSTLAGRFCNLKNRKKDHFHGRKKRNTTNTVNKNDEMSS